MFINSKAAAAYPGLVFPINLGGLSVSELNSRLVISRLLKPRMGLIISLIVG
jgi:hypothetical protein